MNKLQRLFGRMRAPQFLVGLLVALSFLTGCATPQQNPYLYTGAGLGAALGAGMGAAINHNDPWRGAAVGALMGTALGGAAGEVYGRNNPYTPPQQQGYYQQQPQQPYYGPAPAPRSSAPGPGYSYNTPPAAQNHAYHVQPPAPATPAPDDY